MSPLPGILAVGGAWLAYFSIHSLLASRTVKQWVATHRPALVPAYRLFYNFLAVTLLLPLLWLTYRFRGTPVWAWTGAWAYLADGLLLTALVGFLWSLRYYDMQIFLGLRQWRERVTDPGEPGPLCLSPLHRYVRHPWYTLGLMIVWTRDMDAVWLISAVAITGYFLVGSRLEERKLLLQYGEAYRLYRDRVPAFLPWIGRALSRAEAQQLTDLACQPGNPDRRR